MNEGQQAGAGRKQSADWYELRAGSWNRRIKNERGDYDNALYDYVFGYYVGHEVRHVLESKGGYPEHDELVVTLGGGDRMVKCTMLWPGNATRMFATFLPLIAPGQRIRLSVFKGSVGDSNCLLVEDDPSGARLGPRLEYPSEIADRCKTARAALGNATADSRKRLQREFDGVMEDLDAWLRSEVLEKHPGWKCTASAAIDGDAGDAHDPYDPFEDDSPAEIQKNVAVQHPATAFGYEFTRFPPVSLWTQPTSDGQKNLLAEQAAKHNFSEGDMILVRRAVLNCCGIPVTQHMSRGGSGLLYDFLASAPGTALHQALNGGDEEPTEPDPYA